MKPKIAIVSGGTSGVGLSIVEELASNNFNVYFIGTNEVNGTNIEARINKENKTESMFISLDLSKLGLVKQFIKDFKAKHNRLDLLVNTAGVMLPKAQKTKEGFDKTFAIGYLSAFLLAQELSPLLERGTNPRIVNVSGGVGQVLKPKLDFNNLDFNKDYVGFKTAIATVHAKTVLTEILAEQFANMNIDVNAFHPGVVKSNLSRNMPSLLRLIFRIAGVFMSKTSKNGIYASLSPELIGVTGKLIIGKKLIALQFAKSYKDKLLNKTVEMLEKI